MKLDVFPIRLLKDNYAYIISCNGHTAVIDPSEAGPILEALYKRDLKLDYIINTHHHADHTLGNLELKKETGASLLVSYFDQNRIQGADEGLEGESFLDLGGLPFKVINVPGHTNGHMALYGGGCLFSGDTLFSLGCGTVFEGTHEELWGSLKRLRALPDSTKLYCGHEYTEKNCRFALSLEPESIELQEKLLWIESRKVQGKPTIPSLLGEEKKLNPFLKADNAAFQFNILGRTRPPLSFFTYLRGLKDHF